MLLYRVLVIAWMGLLAGGCSSLTGVPAGPPLSERQVEEAVYRMQEQESMVASFYTRGIITAKSWLGEEQANIVMAGSRQPFRIKIEITHTWGQPVLHLLIDRGRLEVLSFADSTLYVGDFTPEALSRFLPGALSEDLIWSVLRGYPTVPPHHARSSPHPNRIELTRQGDKVEVIDLSGVEMHPQRAVFPEQQVALTFSDMVESEGIFYAREVEVDHKKAKGRLVLRKEKTLFNNPVPDEVFTIAPPPGFMVSRL